MTTKYESRGFTVTASDNASIQLVITEPDGSTGSIDITDISATLISIGYQKQHHFRDNETSVTLGYITTEGTIRFYHQGKRIPKVEATEAIAYSVVKSLKDLVASERSELTETN